MDQQIAPKTQITLNKLSEGLLLFADTFHNHQFGTLISNVFQDEYQLFQRISS